MVARCAVALCFAAMAHAEGRASHRTVVVSTDGMVQNASLSMATSAASNVKFLREIDIEASGAPKLLRSHVMRHEPSRIPAAASRKRRVFASNLVEQSQATKNAHAEQELTQRGAWMPVSIGGMSWKIAGMPGMGVAGTESQEEKQIDGATGPTQDTTDEDEATMDGVVAGRPTDAPADSGGTEDSDDNSASGEGTGEATNDDVSNDGVASNGGQEKNYDDSNTTENLQCDDPDFTALVMCKVLTGTNAQVATKLETLIKALNIESSAADTSLKIEKDDDLQFSHLRENFWTLYFCARSEACDPRESDEQKIKDARRQATAHLTAIHQDDSLAKAVGKKAYLDALRELGSA